MLGLEDQLSLLHEAKVRTKPAWMTSRSNQEAWTRGSSLQHHRGRTLRVSLYPEYLLSNTLILSTMLRPLYMNELLFIIQVIYKAFRNPPPSLSVQLHMPT